MNIQVPVIDLFAGPGGLGEGFSRSTATDFRIVVSIEKDEMAFETLRLRAAHRALMRSQGPAGPSWHAWDQLVLSCPWRDLFATAASSADPAIREACEAAEVETWHCELGPGTREEVAKGVRSRLRPFMRGRRLPDNIVMIGGPPCQAYSIVGRARNRGTIGYRADKDHRHYLYREYLQLINHLRPAVFIMENVKGMLSSSVRGDPLFSSIRSDLCRPDAAMGVISGLEYRLVSLASDSLLATDPQPDDFVIQAERHGVPQARHRVVICGVRTDVLACLSDIPQLPRRATAPSVREAIGDLPRLSPAISFRGKGMDLPSCYETPLFNRALRELGGRGHPDGSKVSDVMVQAVALMRSDALHGSGADRAKAGSATIRAHTDLRRWLADRIPSVLANHESRAHKPDDLVRYLFVSSFGRVHGRSPKLRDFPRCLLPDHANVDPDDIGSAIFKDRFRVQVADQCATTVTSHIGKDGHAFIHPDPEQCRSLTVREAARLQTFPDSYVFLGNRTSQYTQVGNAVPPLLAAGIADAVGRILTEAGLA